MLVNSLPLKWLTKIIQHWLETHISFLRKTLAPGLLISTNEICKLCFLMLAILQHEKGHIFLVLAWGMPQLLGSLFEGVASDIFGKEVIVWRATFFASISTLLGVLSYLFPNTLFLGEVTFTISFIIFGTLSIITPAATALIGDKHSFGESLKKYYSCATFFRAFPWAFFGIGILLLLPTVTNQNTALISLMHCVVTWIPSVPILMLITLLFIFPPKHFFKNIS